ncbi:hypothetical protein BH20ACT3_BH20ACT3_13670 [soil metagenome]
MTSGAQAQRAKTARVLLETTDLSMSDVAFAAGFDGTRQFNDTVRDVFATTPSTLRASATNTGASIPGTMTVCLAFRPPLWPDSLFGHLAATAVPGVEEWRDGAYRRTLRLPFGSGIVALSPRDAHVSCRLTLSYLRDFPVAVARCRRFLDLYADPFAVDTVLARSVALRPIVEGSPGRRVPGTVDEQELALRVVLGQQISTAAARTHTGRLVAACGDAIDDPEGGLTHLFPTAEAVADVDSDTLALPHSRRRTLLVLAETLADGQLDLGVGSDRDTATERLVEIPGVGPWTASTIAMRALGDPDAFLPTDLGVRRAAESLGLGSSPKALTERARRWRPWRAYAVQYLWGVGDHPINHLPPPASSP